MARVADRLPENMPGPLYVDASCIDCDACRQIAPQTFGDGDRSYVKHQPDDELDWDRALMALVTCPTSSIGVVGEKCDVAAASRRFPEEISAGVYYCGFASEDSYGASSYLIRRPDGNVLVDSPRAARPLLERIEELGGVRVMFLTHRDDVADHAKFHARFGCERVLHRADVGGDTRTVERQISGDGAVPLADDLVVIPVPGHTRGSAALWYRAPGGETFLFSGDHLWASGDGEGLSASRGVCWYSWSKQTDSVERLLAHDFTWVLPGHGRRFHTDTDEEMRGALRSLVARMRARH